MAGTPSRSITSLTAATASLSEAPGGQVERDGGGDEQALVVDRRAECCPAQLVTADSGTIVSGWC